MAEQGGLDILSEAAGGSNGLWKSPPQASGSPSASGNGLESQPLTIHPPSDERWVRGHLTGCQGCWLGRWFFDTAWHPCTLFNEFNLVALLDLSIWLLHLLLVFEADCW